MSNTDGATATYRGTGITTNGWVAARQEAAEAQLDCQVTDLTAQQESVTISAEGNNGALTSVTATRVSTPPVTRAPLTTTTRRR